MEYPRVLHVGFNPIGTPTNTGLTLASMFGAWPRSSLFELYLPSRQEFTPSPWAIETPTSVAPIDGLIRRTLGSRLPAPVADGLNNSISRRGTGSSMRTRIRAGLTALNDVGPVVARGRWLDALRMFEPQVLHSLLGGVRALKLVDQVARRLDIPVVPHFMDDWERNLFADGQFLGLPRREVERVFERILERAPLCLVVGTDMQVEFEARYDRPCVTVGNSVDFADEETWQVGSSHREEDARLRYVGGLHLGRTAVLERVAQGLLHVRSETVHANAHLVVHAPPSDAPLAAQLASKYPGVLVAGESLQADEVPAVLCDSRALVFVESSLRAILQYTRLSVSTKVPEYLATRLPIVAIGPGEQASIRALRNSSMCSCASGEDSEAIAAALQLALEAQKVSRVELDSETVSIFDRAATQARLRSALAAAAEARLVR